MDVFQLVIKKNTSEVIKASVIIAFKVILFKRTSLFDLSDSWQTSGLIYAPLRGWRIPLNIQPSFFVIEDNFAKIFGQEMTLRAQAENTNVSK